MKRLSALAPLLLALALPLFAAPRHAPKGWKTFDGPNFSLLYPATWKAKSGRSDKDAALFLSPDGSAQFAVYSPLWNGNPTDLNIDPKREKRVSQLKVSSRAKDGAKSKIETRWQTFRALNGSYSRSIVDVENTTLNTRRVFGFKYQNAATYKKFLPLFQKFKASLEQYSD